jgi:hypothetical protein
MIVLMAPDTTYTVNELAEEVERQRKRLDSKLESEGAEFLVLGLLLVEGIQAMKAYTRFPGYDLLAFNPEKNRQRRIQVKSRWATNDDRAFLMKNFDCDIVVHVALNRGYGGRRKISSGAGREAPQIYVMPSEVAKAAQDPKSSWGKIHLRNIPDLQKYLDNWSLVRDFLELPAR